MTLASAFCILIAVSSFRNELFVVIDVSFKKLYNSRLHVNTYTVNRPASAVLLQLSVFSNRSVEEERNRLSSEVELLDTQIHDDQEEQEVKSQRISRLEKDLRDMRVQLEHKIELGNCYMS